MQSIHSVRGIRAMALKGAFEERFASEAASAEMSGKKAAWSIAIGGAASAGMPFFAQGEAMR
jgi:ATP-binding cassette subfamily B (MDR/TAP) protein 1